MQRGVAISIIGWGLFGLSLLSLFLRALWKIESGEGAGTYYNYKGLPFSYWAGFITLGIMGVIGLLGLFYKVKRVYRKHVDLGKNI